MLKKKQYAWRGIQMLPVANKHRANWLIEK